MARERYRMRPSLLPFLLIALTIPAIAATKHRAVSKDRCTTVVTPATLSFPGNGGHATFDVTVNGGCNWSATGDSWIALSANGNRVSVDAGANSGSGARTGLIHVRDAVVVVTQEANNNLVVNGGFDNGIANWSEANSGPGSAVVGANGVLITSNAVQSGRQLSQCVNLTGGKTYEAGVRVLIPPGQAAGVINFGVYEYWVPDCTVTAGYHKYQVLSASAPLGTPFDQTITENTDANTRSVLVVIGAGGTTNPPFSAWFDDVYLRQKP